MTTLHGDGSGIEDLLARYGEPFAKALAVFVREIERDHAAWQPASPPQANALGLSIATPAMSGELASIVADIESGAANATVFDDDTARDMTTRRLKVLLAKRGMTQKDLADCLGVSTNTISRALANPDQTKVSTLRDIARVLDARLADFL
ncbi:MAG: helix-turn-helix transcriptional regulator [Planctomycetota bacterium]